ncbi:hypothetical protein LZ30DRAFT_654962 [Colletotrichum cereale]|nr:hypothetical protein LZ30DRAFT_654962 [Colletotrichum cereale]
MRTSTLTVAVVSVVALLSSVKAAAADEKVGKPERQGETQRVAASLKPKYDTRSPQGPNDFVSYDYGYSYPAPPPPTTYAELSSSSAVTSLASSNNASYTGVSSVASITGTSGVSGSAPSSSAVSASATVTLSDSVATSLPASVTATRSTSTAASESFKNTTSFEVDPPTSSSDAESGTLASVTDTDVPYIPSAELSDSTTSSHTATLGSNTSASTSSVFIPSLTLSGSVSVISSRIIFSSSDSTSISSKCSKHTTGVHELVNHGAFPLQLLHNLIGDLEYDTRTIFHFDKRSAIFLVVFVIGLAITDDFTVPVADRHCRCHT